MTIALISDVSSVYFPRYYGRMDVTVTFSAFVIAISLLLQRGNPRFAQLTSSVFGLFYCGYLPSFWVKLRSGLAAPALNTSKFLGWIVFFALPALVLFSLLLLIQIMRVLNILACAHLISLPVVLVSYKGIFII
jgi:hypothetical protein